MIFPAVLFSILFVFAAPAESLLSDEDFAGLYSLRASLGIRSLYWPQLPDPCSNWTGVACRSARVVSLELTGLLRPRFGRRNPQFALEGIRNLTALERLVVSGFPLPLSIPDWLGSGVLPSLSALVLKSASLSGEIPYSLGSAAGLRILTISDNSITGNIPPTLGNLANLSSLDLSGNLLSSSIPPELSALRNLSYLNLSFNYLSGVIPPSFALLVKLKTLSLDGNSLEGVVPAQLGDLSLLESLDLSSNSLNGVLPESLFSGASHLRLVNLSRNFFEGGIPNSTWSLSELKFFDASSNSFTGFFPKLFGRNVTVGGGLFNLSANFYYGFLYPGTLLFLQSFSSVDLSKNYLKGSEPLATKMVNFVDGSNCFSDALNQRSSGDCEKFYKERNMLLAGLVPPAPSLVVISQSDKKNTHRWMYIMTGVIGGIVLLIALFPLVFFCLKRTRNQTSNQGALPLYPKLPPSSKTLVSLPGVIGENFTYEQLVQATSGFNSMNLIKHGHSGDLYIGILKESVTVVVKKVNVLTARNACLAELDLFAKDMKGRLAPFIGHCLEKEDEKFLIYKFMPYGDLSMALYRAPRPEEEGLQSLDWITRLKIATGVAEALCVLHHECNPPLVHRDIQSSSILLDEKFEVHLGSLSEVTAQESESHSNVITRIWRRPQAPEQGIPANGSACSPTTCAYDIYCLGKVMLELITGKLGISSSADSIDSEWKDQTLSYININDKDLIKKIVDPTLIVDEDLLEEVWAMAIMARCCLNPRPHKRPLAQHLLKALQNPVKVVREESFSGSGPLMGNSFHNSWVGAFLGGLLHSSPESAPVSKQAARDQRQTSPARPKGSLGDHSLSHDRASK